MKNIYIFLLIAFSYSLSFACDKIAIKSYEIYDNCDGTFTCKVNLCLEGNDYRGPNEFIKVAFPASKAKILSAKPESITYSNNIIWNIWSNIGTTQVSLTGEPVTTIVSGDQECFDFEFVLDKDPGKSGEVYEFYLGAEFNDCHLRYNYYCPKCLTPPDTKPCSIANLKENKNSIFNLAPNPATSQITVSFESIQTENILKIHNLNGQLLFEQKLEKEVTTINLPEFTKGIYLVEINGIIERLLIE